MPRIAVSKAREAREDKMDLNIAWKALAEKGSRLKWAELKTELDRAALGLSHQCDNRGD